MLTYRASDIIKRAMQIADLENSSFISYDEQLALLNEAYVTLYQKAIDADTRAFVKVLRTTSNRIQMPVDFYQLKSVCIDINGYLQPLTRRPADQNLHTLSYEMTGNELNVYGSFSGEIRIEYIPQPKTITFPPLESNAKSDLVDANNEAVDIDQLEDTVLNFPNSTYFPYLAYMLAVQFLSKQGKDPSSVYALAQVAEDTFYSSMPADEWTSVRITNVYNV